MATNFLKNFSTKKKNIDFLTKNFIISERYKLEQFQPLDAFSSFEDSVMRISSLNDYSRSFFCFTW